MLYIVLALAVFGIDQFFKKYTEDNKVLNEEEKIWKGKIILTKYYNKGAFLNFLDQWPNGVLAFSSTMLGAVLAFFAMVLSKKKCRLLKAGAAFLAGGASSNVLDRTRKGKVVDYFSFHSEKCKKINQIVFNLADLAIFLGGILAALGILLKKEK